MKWKQGNGKEINYKSMTDEDLNNAILWMCRNKGFRYREKDGLLLVLWVHYMAKELHRRELKEKAAKKKINTRKHELRFSDSSLYDEICTVCGATDAMGDYRLDSPCKGTRT